MASIGAHPASLPIFAHKSEIVPYKLLGVRTPAANILKQEMLAAGGDAVVPTGCIVNADKYVNVLAKKNVTIKNMDTVTEGSSNLSEDEETFYFCDFVVTYNRITKVENEYIGGVSISSDGLEKPDMESKTSPVNIEIQEE